MAEWVIKRGADLVPVPWRNGLGTTRDVITVLAPDGSLRWQVSIAELVQDAPFSYFPHCDRVFTPVAGAPPPELAFDGGAFVPCPLLVPKRFSGEVPTLSRIPSQGRAFNAVFDRRSHACSVDVMFLAAGEAVAAPDGAELVLYCHAGELSLGAQRLASGDSVQGSFRTVIASSQACAILVTVRTVG